MDLRLIIVFLPVVLALGWVIYNIGRPALAQLQAYLNKSKAA